MYVNKYSCRQPREADERSAAVDGETYKNGPPGRAALKGSLRLEYELSLQFNDSWRCIHAQTGAISRRGTGLRTTSTEET